MSDIRYPIGPFHANASVTREECRNLLSQLEEAPGLLRAAVENLSSAQLDTAYRPGGWTVRQVIHHLADSHLNWYIRTKLAITENEPVIKPFDENLWARLPDACSGPVQASLLILEGLHRRWVQLFESLEPSGWSRRMIHPERGELALNDILPMTAWHCRHHTAHITELRKRMGW